MMQDEIQQYNIAQAGAEQDICMILMQLINEALPEASAKVWHGHPVWFLDGNPIAGYSKRKAGINLMFWSGQSFDETALKPEGKFKAAEICYTATEQIHPDDLLRWLHKSREIQWDYKNLVKRKGVLERLK